MNRKGWVMGMLVVLLLLSSGCGQKPQAAPTTGTGNAGSNEAVGEPVAAAPQNEGQGSQGEDNGKEQAQSPLQTTSIEAYYTDDNMLELTKETRQISFESDQDKYLAALKTLQSSENTGLFALWEKAVFHSATLADGVLTVDMSLPDEARQGAGGEALAIEALTKTLFQFQEVNAIELLVDGEKVDTLMGHVELDHPLLRN
ncbi:MAG: GerMN domain-containing protein [Paenibacillus macerans]|uniref:Sporulation and spore germination family protein n=1 Tax=Paenibacillus macerans TaxID=44252 RepID=A0A090YBM5_PAEMA|nr:GerMN domain-containing protein [Paenibacillus macerans]KFM95889.1 sporulation and spore germination family protein [Paenibacillus macerans]MBS5912974.1 GerMN domain-containing protein [Paenibacillus macerans]MCY7558597.1 GerMN domain-containing protein [Paenibacillus macerans]MDU7475500.1 GerMN domain-containing protein [Paenibacillus macerans]MEC0152814.1 GerMN domain-containing protein [Paenibacillus macerans]